MIHKSADVINGNGPVSYYKRKKAKTGYKDGYNSGNPKGRKVQQQGGNSCSYR